MILYKNIVWFPFPTNYQINNLKKNFYPIIGLFKWIHTYFFIQWFSSVKVYIIQNLIWKLIV